MIAIQKCQKDRCIVITLDGHTSLMSEEEQKYFVDWMKKNKKELL